MLDWKAGFTFEFRLYFWVLIFGCSWYTPPPPSLGFLQEQVDGWMDGGVSQPDPSEESFHFQNSL